MTLSIGRGQTYLILRIVDLIPESAADGRGADIDMVEILRGEEGRARTLL